ncbi:unnamed protein product [Rhizoctonia solani]|uniref:Uncharacterized protein n=1 Tax=Rhizoctonia solani TaxID=456999 RepID=A0A8H2X591_9AGAM|nr:unnamed protein product [Rhizoctonia solani]
MSTPVVKGNVLIIPGPGANALKEVTIQWSQDLGKPYKEVFYTGIVKNKTTGVNGKGKLTPGLIPLRLIKLVYTTIVLFFVHSAKYNTGSALTKKSEVDGYYELTVDDNYRYGQKNKDGDGRFVVLQSPDYKMYQHRFFRAALEALVFGPTAKDVVAALGYLPQKGGNALSLAGDVLNAAEPAMKIVGDDLHKF